MVQRILQLKQENINLFGWEIHNILKAELAQAKSAIKNGSTNCLKSKQAMITKITVPSVSSINRILRSSERLDQVERQAINTSSSDHHSISNLHASHLSNATSNAINSSLVNHIPLNHSSINHASLNNSTLNSSIQNGRLNDKNLINLNSLNLMNSIKQEEQAKLRNENNKDFLAASNLHSIYHQNSSSNATLNNSSLQTTSNLMQSTPTSVQNLLQLSSSQLIMVNQGMINNQQSTCNQASLDHLTANQAFQQLANNYLNANLNAVMANNLLHQTSLNQTNQTQLSTSNLDHATFLLNQMQQQQRLLQSTSSSCSSTTSSLNSSSTTNLNSLNGNNNSLNNNKQILNSVNNLINSTVNCTQAKQQSSLNANLNAIQEPLTLSTLVNNLNNNNSNLTPNSLSASSNNLSTASSQLTSVMNNLLLTTKQPNMFTQFLQQTASDNHQMLNSLTTNSINLLSQLNDKSPTRQTKKYSSYNIADILMNEYKDGQAFKSEFRQELKREAKCELDQIKKIKINDKLLLNQIKNEFRVNDDKMKLIKDKINYDKIEKEEEDIKVDILD